MKTTRTKAGLCAQRDLHLSRYSLRRGKGAFRPRRTRNAVADVRLAVDYGAIAPQGKGGFPNTTWEDPAREFPMDNNCQNLNI